MSSLIVFYFYLDAVSVPLALDKFCVHQELHSLLSEDFLIGFGDFGIESRAESVRALNNCDFGANSVVDGAKLEANNSTSNDEHFFWNLRKAESSSRSNNSFLIDLQHAIRKRHGYRASGNDGVFERDDFLLAVLAGDGESVGGLEGAPALEVVNLVLLEQAGDSLS